MNSTMTIPHSDLPSDLTVYGFNYDIARPWPRNENRLATARKPIIEAVSVTLYSGPHSPILNLLCVQNKVIKKITLRCPGNDEGEEFILTLEHCTINSVHVNGVGGSPTETVSIAFKRYFYEYKKGAVSTRAAWDIAKRKSIKFTA